MDFPDGGKFLHMLSDLSDPSVQAHLHAADGAVPLLFFGGMSLNAFHKNALVAVPLPDVHPPIPAACDTGGIQTHAAISPET